MDLDSFLVSLYVLVDDWWKLNRSSERPKIGRPALLTDSEVITLAILEPSGPACAARGTSGVSLGRTCAPTSRSALLPEPVQSTHPSPGARDARSATRICPKTRRTFVGLPRVVDTTLVPAMVRVRASRKGLFFCGQASFGRSASKT